MRETNGGKLTRTLRRIGRLFSYGCLHLYLLFISSTSPILLKSWHELLGRIDPLYVAYISTVGYAMPFQRPCGENMVKN